MSQFNDTSLKKNWKNENFWLWIFSLVQTILLWDFVNLTYPWPSEGCNFWTRCQIKNLRLQICPPWSIDTCRYPQSFHTTSLEQYFCKKPKSPSWLRSYNNYVHLTIPIKVSKVSDRFKVKTMSFTSQKYMLINVAVFITTQASNTLLQWQVKFIW